MKDRSHKLAFMAATAGMYLAVLYGSEATLSVLVPGGPWRSAEMFPLKPVLAAFVAEPSRAEPNQRPDTRAAASVIPNSASCPAAGVLAEPPSIDRAIGNDAPALTREGSPRPQSNASVGTGASCPQLYADAGRRALQPLPRTVPKTAGEPETAGLARP